MQQFKFRVRPIRTRRSFLRKTTLSETISNAVISLFSKENLCHHTVAKRDVTAVRSLSPKKSVNFRDHSDSGLHHTILSAITEIYGQSTIYSVHIVNTFVGVFCNMFRYYVIISFFLTIKYSLILKYLINS